MGSMGSCLCQPVEEDHVCFDALEEDRPEESVKVEDALRFLKLFDPQKTGFLPRQTIATIVQLCSRLSEEKLEEILKGAPSNSRGFEYSYIVPFILWPEVPIYDLEDPKSLAKYLLDADVRLVRAPYFYKLLQSNRCMPRRQEAEHDSCEVNGEKVSALVSHEEVAEWALGRRDALVCSVSHAWESREHPDPCNFQLQNLVDSVALWDAAFVDDVWLFYDYVSLYQFQRDTAEQEASFRRAMSNMHMMYAHQSTLTFRLECLTPADTWTARKEDSTYKVPIYHLPSNSIAWVPLSELMENFAFYLDRGWCRAEIEWSAARGIPAQNIAIDGEPGKEVTVKMVPTAPEVFGKRMTTSAFTHRNDASTVVDLQRKIFHQKVTVRKHLKLEHLTQADMVELAASLPYFPQLKVLDIYIFQAGEAEAKAFFEVLSSMKLEKLSLTYARMALDVGSLDVATFASMIELSFESCHMGNRLAEVIAEVLKTNRTLTRINLKGNQITDEGVKAVADAMAYNTTVTDLDLRYNQGIDSDVGKQAIRLLEERLEGNRAAAEAAEAKRSRIRGDHRADGRADKFPGRLRIQALADKLTHGGTLSKLSVFNANLGDAVIQVLIEALQHNRSVTDVNLTKNNITYIGAKALAQMLTVNLNITHVYLGGNQIGDAGTEALAQMLKQNRSITNINLHANQIGSDGIQVLAEALQENDAILEISLREIEYHPRRLLSPNPFEETDEGRQALDRIKKRCEANREARATADIKKLVEELKTGAKTEINLRNHFIGDAHVQALSKALKINKSVTRINLEQNLIQDAGAQALSEVLRHNRCITHINLSCNEIGLVGAKALANTMQKNKTILNINLSANPWTRMDGAQEVWYRIEKWSRANQEVQAAAAFKKLVEELKTGAKTEINLRNHFIRDAQVQALSKALKINKSVTRINLEQNLIQDAGAQALSEVLRHNRCITHINLSCNEIGLVGAKALADSVQQNDAILDINLEVNPWRHHDVKGQVLEGIKEQCKANRAAAEARAKVPDEPATEHVSP
ncbi:unnamed protein product [Durusdinium trenchii]|uniref:LRR and CARD domains-containing protein 3 (Nucleotide-binding oligomerization domain protein 3 n=2 Tax=Durusdinium trenchii TaxID=1381693 RepID=A0ABP0HHI9_9DINO